MKNPYDDIINLPRHVSSTRPQMSISNRAAQFSPFAALTGYDAAIVETARLTDKRIELDEYAIDGLNKKIGILADAASEHPDISVSYFQKDDKKAGGAYVTVSGAMKRIDDYEGVVVLTDGRKIAISDVLEIDCELFKFLL